VLPLLLSIASGNIDIQGNIALPSDVYLTVLEMSTSTSTPQQVERTLTDFLHASGYDLATVEATDEHGRIRVEVDEGRLDKIIFVGETAANAVRLQIAVDLPGRIFNRSLLEKKLAEVIAETDVVNAQYEIVPVREIDHPGIQVKDPGLIPGYEIFRPGEPHELRIRLIHEGFTRGLDATFGFKAPDGFFLRGDYKYGGLFFDRDLGQISAGVAIRLVDAFTTAGTRVGLSEASLRLHWYTPPFVRDALRSFLLLEAQALGARRTDLGLKSYLQSPLRASLNFQVSVHRYFQLALGLGADYRFLYALDDEDDIPRSPIVDATNESQARMFGQLQASSILNPEELRRDRKHQLSLGVQHFSGGTEDGKPITEVFVHWQKVFLYGWDEIWLGLDGALLFGEVPFYHEVSLGDFVRNTFSQDYLQRVGALHFEYRLSLSRDVFKIGFYDDVAIYDQDGVTYADTIGVGLHVLLLDTFQLSSYVGVGINSEAEFDVGFGVEVKQAY
jgi:hypothetical protein